MATSNVAILTHAHRVIASKKRARKEQVKEVVFDETARREFLTGFHKRKLLKHETAKQKAIEREKQERLEARREKRQFLAEKALQNAAEVEAAYGGQLPDAGASDDEWEGFGEASSSKGKAKAEKEEEYEDEELLATVTVIEDFDPEVLLHGPKPTNKDPEDEPDSQTNARKTVKFDTKAKPSSAGVKKTRSKVSAKAKDIRYQTNSARKAERGKQLKRKTEKAERAGGKGARRKPSGRGKR